MTGLVSPTARIIEHSEWLLSVRYFAMLDRSKSAFYSGAGKFGGKIFELILMEFKEN